MEVDKTDWLPNYVVEWEAREQQFRKLLTDTKTEIDRRYAVLLTGLTEEVSRLSQESTAKTKQLDRIQSLSIIGKWLIQYSERERK